MNKEYKTKEWKILSLWYLSREYILNEELKGYFYFDPKFPNNYNQAGTISFSTQDSGFYKVTHKIYSIQRNSDQEIFTIGDEIVSSKTPFEVRYAKFQIEKIELINNQIILRGKNKIPLGSSQQTIKLENAKNLIKSVIPAIVASKLITTKQKGMKVVIKDKKEYSRKLKGGDIVFNRKGDYYGILSINGGAITTTAKIFILKVNNPLEHNTTEAFKYLDVNVTDCELFEGTITLENEK